MSTIAYARVSSSDQHLDRQEDALEPYDKLFTDHCSGRSIIRPGWVDCLKFLREGDTLVVHSIDRLARNLLDLQTLLKTLVEEKRITVRFIKEQLTFSNGASPIQKLVMQIMGAFAEFERSLILERQADGIAATRRRGKEVGGRPRMLSTTDDTELRRRYEEGESLKNLMRFYGISRSTLYRRLRPSIDGVA